MYYATSIKSALNMRSETVINMKINEKHLFIMSAGKLYVTAIIKKIKYKKLKYFILIKIF